MPSEINFPFETDLFLTLKHLRTQHSGGPYSFLLFVCSETQAEAILNLNQMGQTVWISPAKAPFGGIQCVNNLSIEHILFMLGCVECFIKEQKGKRITIKSAPAAYDFSGFQKNASAYDLAGFVPILRQRNLHIDVNSTAFENIISAPERRRLKKCRKADFELKSWHTLKEFYAFAESVRVQQGYSISLSYAELEYLFENFPENFKLFSLYAGEELIAATVTVRVNGHTLYNFLSADLQSYRNFSPMVMLLEGIYNYCQAGNIRILDLGISVDDSGNEKPGLIRFKKNIGSQESAKITWQKNLDSQTII